MPSLDSAVPYSATQLHVSGPLSSCSSSGSDEDDVLQPAPFIRRHTDPSLGTVHHQHQHQHHQSPSQQPQNLHHHRVSQPASDRLINSSTAPVSSHQTNTNDDDDDQDFSPTPLPTRLQLHSAKLGSNKPPSSKSLLSLSSGKTSPAKGGGQTMQAKLARKRADSLKWSKYQIQPVSTTIELNLSNDELRRL